MNELLRVKNEFVNLQPFKRLKYRPLSPQKRNYAFTGVRSARFEKKRLCQPLTCQRVVAFISSQREKKDD